MTRSGPLALSDLLEWRVVKWHAFIVWHKIHANKIFKCWQYELGYLKGCQNIPLFMSWHCIFETNAICWSDWDTVGLHKQRMLLFTFTLFVVLNVHAFQQGNILTDVDPYAGTLSKTLFAIHRIWPIVYEPFLSSKSKIKITKWFYKRSGMSNGQQALIDAEDFLKKKSNDHPKSALDLSPEVIGLWVWILELIWI